MKRAQGVIIGGPSGGGKTTYAGEMHAKASRLSIFLSPKRGDEYPQDIQAARRAVLSAGGGQVLVDEAQRAPTFKDGDAGPCYTMLHEDREQGLKPVIITQNPQDLRTSEHGYGPVQQAQYFVWVGESRSFASGFTDWLKLPKDEIPSEHYQFRVWKPTDPPELVASGETNPEFSL